MPSRRIASTIEKQRKLQAYRTPDDETIDEPSFPEGWHVVTVDEVHKQKALTCPICGMDRPQLRADDDYCDEACEWLATNDPEVSRKITERGSGPQLCAAEGCDKVVIQYDGPGRPRKFHSKKCERRDEWRRRSERQGAQ